jgi:hypothetical protein
MSNRNQVLKKAWSIVNKDRDNRTKLQALNLINDRNKYKMDLATGGAICSEAEERTDKHFTEDRRKDRRDGRRSNYKRSILNGNWKENEQSVECIRHLS